MKEKYIHFIGIGGIGCSSLAQIFHHQGKIVSGSDLSQSETVNDLKKEKIKIYHQHSTDNINEKIELIIYSPAVPSNNLELIHAKDKGIKTLSYPQALGELTKNHYTIAIAGTHGKSTTTAFTSLIAIEGKADPTVVIGTKLKELNAKNYRLGKSNYFIVEACEYKDSFLNFEPNILIITNLEADHLDYFKSFNNYKSTFKKLVQKLPPEGILIINKDDKNTLEISKKAPCQIIKWSKKDKKCEYFFDGKFLHRQKAEAKNGKPLKEKILIAPGVIGEFNRENAIPAAIANKAINVETPIIEEAIQKFQGTWRRMEEKNTKYSERCIFIDDYAHHPTAIKKTLTAIRDHYPKKKILCIFQPHQYSRTYQLLDQFADAFVKADAAIIPNIYQVRDTKEDLEKVNVDKLIKVIKKYSDQVTNGQSLSNILEMIPTLVNKYDLIVTMGAGDLHDIYQEL